MYKSPFAPPFSPGSPSPLNTIVWFSSIPAGIFTETLTCFLIIPFPLQSTQGSGIISPVPLQFVQGLTVCICPNIVVCVCFICPVPWHIEQVCFLVPGFAPSPWQVWQVSFLVKVICFSVPKKDSSKVMSKLARKSAPCLGPLLCLALVLPPKPPPKNEENISPRSPKSPKPSNPPEEEYE